MNNLKRKYKRNTQKKSKKTGGYVLKSKLRSRTQTRSSHKVNKKQSTESIKKSPNRPFLSKTKNNKKSSNSKKSYV